MTLSVSQSVSESVRLLISATSEHCRAAVDNDNDNDNDSDSDNDNEDYDGDDDEDESTADTIFRIIVTISVAAKPLPSKPAL